MGTTRQNWSKTYAPHWAQMKVAFRDMDRLALQEVLIRHREIQPDEV
jgi:hypothetical protein